MESPLDKLKRMTAWETEPALSEDDLNAALGTAPVPDLNGNAPTDEEWIPTYDLNAAAAEAWLIKAARASALVAVDPPGSGITTSRVYDNCREMARVYRSRGRAAVRVR
jgi:hypothetical protein